MIAFLDCTTGVSGDKFLGALIDAGFDPAEIKQALSRMGLQGVHFGAASVVSNGIAGMAVSVSEPHAAHRSHPELRELLLHAPAPEHARTRAVAGFDALVQVEAHVHGVIAEQVHLHEIGAADTLVDLLGIALGLEALEIDRVIASPVAVGSGAVITSHGKLPVPAPATAELLEGVPIEAGPASGELTTPTGAAALKAFVDGFGPVPPMVLRRVGVGCGSRDLGVPNVCRLLVGEPIESQPESDTVILLESNIDHLTPEELAIAAHNLLSAGALDVWQAPIAMKKGRLGVMLCALAHPLDAPRLADLFMAETGTLGVRAIPADRRVAQREVNEIATSLGSARFKVATLPSGERRIAVESDDAARIAREQRLPVDSVARILEFEAAELLGIRPRNGPDGPARRSPR